MPPRTFAAPDASSLCMIAPFAALAGLSPSLVSPHDRCNQCPCALVSQALSPFMIAAFASLAASSPSWQLPSLPLVAYLPVLSPSIIADFAACCLVFLFSFPLRDKGQKKANNEKERIWARRKKKERKKADLGGVEPPDSAFQPHWLKE